LSRNGLDYQSTHLRRELGLDEVSATEAVNDDGEAKHDPRNPGYEHNGVQHHDNTHKKCNYGN